MLLRWFNMQRAVVVWDLVRYRRGGTDRTDTVMSARQRLDIQFMDMTIL
jgi:hypothetical protein